MECTNIMIVVAIISKILSLIQIIVPILLIISIVILFIKGMKNPDKKIDAQLKNIITALFIVFLIPTIINVGIYKIDSKYDIFSCLDNSFQNGSSTYISTSDTKNNKVIQDVDSYEKGNKVEKNTITGSDFSNDTTYSKKMANIASNKGSNTNWFITVDVYRFRVTVLKKVGGSWTAVEFFNASMGTLTNGRSNTGIFGDITGIMEREWEIVGHDPDYPDAQYFTQYVCTDDTKSECQGFHNEYEVCGNQYCSHGCVRLTDAAAKYIYDTIPIGTKVYIWQEQVVN